MNLKAHKSGVAGLLLLHQLILGMRGKSGVIDPAHLGMGLQEFCHLHGRGLVRRAGSELAWGYRTSCFAPDEVIIECELAADAADPFKVRDKMEANLARRKESQPLSQPTCGSVFKNPEGASIGRLIDELGLKGMRQGKARISEVHGNFIVNDGGAAAADVLALMELVARRVHEAYGLELEPEVRLVGFEEAQPAEGPAISAATAEAPRG